MKDFKERQKEYFEKLRSNPSFIEKIIEGSKDKKSLEIILIPKDERELEVAESMYNMMYDMVDLVEKAAYDELEHIDVDNSSIVNLFVDVINALKSNDENKIEDIKNHLKHKIDVKSGAKLIFEMFVVFSQDPEEAVERIAQRCEFDLYDELSAAQFKLYLNKANEITNSTNDNLNLETINMEDSKQLQGSVSFANEFHRSYTESLNKKKEMKL